MAENVYLQSSADLAHIHNYDLDFILARGKLDSQHHSELINKTKSHNFKYESIHLTNEAVSWWLTGLLY